MNGWIAGYRVPTAALLLASSVHAGAQIPLDRSDPTIVQQTLPESAPTAPVPPRVEIETEPAAEADTAASIVPAAIVVTGNDTIPASAFAPVIGSYVGKPLGQAGLRELAGAIGGVARARGYVFANASIQPQQMAGGIIRVTLEEGKVDAVRTLGVQNAAADRLLAALRTGKPVTKAQLERAILLVGDLPGIRVKENRFVRQEGFGILLVTIVEDRASAYVQFDNRGSKEVGPVRATVLANLRGGVTAGDEIGFIGSYTPLNMREFAFAGARYSLPVGSDGGRVTLSSSYGRSRPGASLRRFDVVGESIDAAAAYRYPLLRSRVASWWGGLELRAVGVDQKLLNTPRRRDRLTTLTGLLSTRRTLAGGSLSGELDLVAGLPVEGVTHEGDPLASRADGDARFGLATLAVDWESDSSARLSLRVAALGQLATRPLLATQEIGVGGPGFARAYDYSERTGDQGVLGSLEVRLNLERGRHDLLDRLQFYGFADGGYVDNLRAGVGGGTLVSAGGGARIGWKSVDLGFEVAMPLNADRFDTRNRTPRTSARLAIRR